MTETDRGQMEIRTFTQWRLSRGLSWRDVAHVAEVSLETVNRAHRGKPLHPGSMAKLAGALDVSIDQVAEFRRLIGLDAPA